MADTLGRLDVAFVGIDTEFRYGDPGDEDTFNEWQDLSALRPLVVSLAAMVRATNGAGYIPVRFSIDVRTSATHAGLSRTLALPLTFVAHHFKSEYLALKVLGIPWPRATFCTWLAAQLLSLGRQHARYVDPEPVDEAAESAADRTAKERRRHATSLLVQLSRYGVAYPFVGDKEAMQRRFARLTDTEPLTSADHEYAVADAYGAAALYLPLRLALAEQGLTYHCDAIELPAAIALYGVPQGQWTLAAMGIARLGARVERDERHESNDERDVPFGATDDRRE